MVAAARRRSVGVRRGASDAESPLQERINEAVSEFGRVVRPKLRGGKGSRENHLRGPLEVLLVRIGRTLGLSVTPYGEEYFKDLGVRPDYVVDVARAQVGCVELKAPDKKGLDPTKWSRKSHDGKQWNKLKLLPNVLYTNGQVWLLHRRGELVGRAELAGPLDEAGERLRPVDGEFGRIVSSFLRWAPEQPRTLSQVVNAVAGLCRLLCEEVLEGIGQEAPATDRRLFMQLAWEWRQLLFPRLSDAAFADAYAQTVTFALLLARVEDIAFEGLDTAQIARQLRKRHPLLGRALTVLTENSIENRSIVLTTLVQVVGAVDWDVLKAGGAAEAYAYLYERFLTVYNPELRRKSGSYYTPAELVSFMVKFVDQILRSSRMARSGGFASDDVVVIDPAMGSGSFLDEIVRTIARTVKQMEGPGQVAPRLREAIPRLMGFEKQAGPFTVAEMRLHRTLKHDFHVEIPEFEPRFLTDTLDDPEDEGAPLWTAYEVLQRNQEEAKRIKREVQVHVVIGNPPFGDKAGGQGGWVAERLLDAFRSKAGGGRYEYVLSSQAIYFWRWATWKVFETYPEQQAIIAFVSPAAFTTTAGFAGMRQYLQREADEGWIIDLSPEGHYPPGTTRLFTKVGQPLCIAFFARYGRANHKRSAKIHYIAAKGLREQKLAFLTELLDPDDPRWAHCSPQWETTFTATPASAAWQEYCPVHELMPWTSRGVTAGRTWVYAPEPETLRQRWEELMRANTKRRRELFCERRDRKLHSAVDPLPGISPHADTLAEAQGPHIPPVQVGYRAFDRQWILPDNRLLAVPRPPLWAVRSEQQIFISEQHTQPLTEGPGLLFESLIPDLDHFMGHHGGRVVPLYRDHASTEPNVTPRLLTYLRDRLGMQITAQDLIAYLAAVAAHPGYTIRFADELVAPGLRVPLSARPELWQSATELGHTVLWLHTYGERFADRSAGRPPGPPRSSASERPMVVRTIPYTADGMPDKIGYCRRDNTLHIGGGLIAPVSRAVWEYRVNGTPVVEKWFRYRKNSPGGRRTSDLDDIYAEHWAPTRTADLLNLVNVLSLCVALEPRQADLLREICSGPIVTRTELLNAAVLPVPAAATKPRTADPEPGTVLFGRIPRRNAHAAGEGCTLEPPPPAQHPRDERHAASCVCRSCLAILRSMQTFLQNVCWETGPERRYALTPVSSTGATYGCSLPACVRFAWRGQGGRLR
jgi:hypothetical protein